MRLAGPDGPGLDREGGGRGSSGNLRGHAKRVLSFPLPLTPLPTRTLPSSQKGVPHPADHPFSAPTHFRLILGLENAIAAWTAQRNRCERRPCKGQLQPLRQEHHFPALISLLCGVVEAVDDPPMRTVQVVSDGSLIVCHDPRLPKLRYFRCKLLVALKCVLIQVQIFSVLNIRGVVGDIVKCCGWAGSGGVFLKHHSILEFLSF